MRCLSFMAVLLLPAMAIAHQPGPQCSLDHLTIELLESDSDSTPVCEALSGYLQATKTTTSASFLRRQLMATTIFSTATCAASREDMTCQVTRRRIVRAVDFEGSVPFALLESDLRRRITLRPGSLLADGELLSTQAKRLEVFLEREGYFGSSVRVEAKPVDGDTPNAQVDLIVFVNAGWSSSLRSIRIEGDPVLEQRRVESTLRHETLGFISTRFRPERLDEDLDELAERLRDSGWPAARVRGRFELDSEAEAVDLVIEVQSGPKVSASFIGNEALDDDDLEEAIDFSVAGVVDSVEIAESLSRIRAAYQDEGYHEAAASVKSQRSTERGLELVYQVTEGERATIGRIDLIGIEPFAPGKVAEEAELLTKTERLVRRGRWKDEWIAADVRSLTRFFRSAGYPTAKTEVRKEKIGSGDLAVIFTVDKGAKREVAAVRFDGLPKELSVDDILSRLDLVAGAPFDEERMPRDHAEVLASLAEGGYTRAKVEQTAGGDEILYRIAPGTQLRYGGVIVRGAFRSSESFIEDRLNLEQGEPLDLVRLGKARRELRALGIFSGVEVEALPRPEGESTWLLIGVQEEPSRTLDLAVSFTTDDLFSVGGDFRDRNLFGRAWRLDLTLRYANASELLTEAKIGRADRLSATLGIPTPFSAPFDVEAYAKYDFENRELFEERRISFQPALVRQFLDGRKCLLCPKVVGAFGYELAVTEFLPKGEVNEIPPADVVENATLGRFIPRLRLEALDDVIDPKAGYKTELRFDFAHSALAPGSDASQFWRVMSSVAIYLNVGAPISIEMGKDSRFGGPLVFALAGTFGTASTYGDQGLIPTSETFYYGGDQSVRGLTRRASTVGKPGATQVFVGSLEMRWYMLPDFPIGALQLAGFVDLGTVAYRLGDLFVDNSISVGPAIRLVTVVGPISLAYGIPVLVDPDFAGTDAAPSSGRLHITFGYSF